MSDMETVQDKTYTYADINQATADGGAWGTRTEKSRAHALTLDIFKSEVREGNIERGYATELFNAIAEANGWQIVTAIATAYTVTVSVFGLDVLEVNGVEAESDDEACELVQGDIEVSDLDINFSITSMGTTGYGSASGYDYDFDSILQDNMEFSATEEEA
jgi:hypothetical protein